MTERARGIVVWRRLLKILHEVSTIGVGGGLAACLTINLTSSNATAGEFAGARLAVAAIAKYMLVPSLAVVLVTGLLAIAATRGYQDAGWAWLKALLGLSVFEATLVTVGATREQAVAAASVVGVDAARMTEMLNSERNTLWLLLALSLVNVVLAVWRPKLSVTIK